MSELFEYLNEHIAIVGVALVMVLGAMAVILAVDSERRNKRNKKVAKLKYALETKERLIVHNDAVIKQLKVDLFAAKEDGKIALEKKQKEIDRLTARVSQLEQDKKQLAKWGSEK